jgi:hypothetical protein
MTLCEESKCNKFKADTCAVFPVAGVEFRQRYGYCPIPDWPKRVIDGDKLRAGQQKSLKMKKKK